ncbi:MAG: helix-turn-helix domain-containing protein [Ignisphaera sp.]|nr:helix-turn-helix domain-containing protein [Ignisphaera sp.]MDW8084768.1 helix-turn-helix domain-containing protein [Ignisphaera sp.]
MRRLMVGNSISVAEFTIDRPKNSFFSKLAELSSSKILLEVAYVPGISKYLVIAYTYNKDIAKYVRLLMQNSDYLTKSKIRKIRYFRDRDLHVIIAVKSACEFFKIAEDSNVSVVPPYIIDKGRRTFVVVGEKRDIELYVDEIARYYGEENVEYGEINSTEKLARVVMRRSLLNLVTEKLTDMELNVVNIAYRNGYFNYPKSSNQETIGSLLGLSKITVNIHMRKALKKMVEEIARASG